MSFDVSRPSQDGHLSRPVDTAAGRELNDPSTGGGGLSDDLSRHLEAALYGPVGIDKLLNRLKQSIYSARELSSFLKERSALEDRYAQGYKKLVRNASDTIRRPEARQGSYARSLDESLRINDRMAENGLQFANALQTMSEELRDLADNTEKGRKHWKHTAMDAERKVTDAEHAQQKARDRYNNASEQYERVRTGEKQGGKFGLKNKTPAQQEEALKEKVDALDQEYAVKTQTAQAERRDFESTHRPQIVRALRDLISECDAALAMQVAKLASISEKHVVSNGMAIAPIKSPEAPGPQPRGLRLIASEMDDRKDFQDYMLDGADPPPAFKGRSRRNTDVEFVNAPKPSTQNFERQATFDSPYAENKKPVEPELPQLPQIGGQDTFSSGFETPRPGMQNQNSYSTGPTEVLQVPYSTQPQQTGVTQEGAPSLPAGRDAGGPQMPPFDRAQAPTGPYNSAPSFDRSQGPQRQDTNGGLPLPTSPGPQRQDTMGLGAGPGPGLQGNAPGPYLGRGGPAPGSYMDPGKNAGPYGAGRGQNVPATRTLPSQQPPRPALPPLQPVFGIHLDELFRRDGSAVPAIVFHCVQAVDTFGLHTEGIYRVPGSTPTVMQLKSEFDHDSTKVNLSDPETFNNDISAVATLLKNFLRDLPDPLLTAAAYHSFIQAAKYEDTIMRRDALHQFINSLPDPNYATLRVLVLHLHRIAMNSDANKMDMRNLSIVFGPTVMGGANVTDAGWQTKVMETILHHTHDIFDPDE